MNWDRMEGEWKQRRGKAVHHWGKMMNDELAAIAVKYEELVGKLQEKYGIAKDEADQQVKDFTKTIGQLKKSNNQLVQLQVSSRNKQRADKKRFHVRNPSRKTIRSKARD